MADLLANLEASLTQKAGASERLRALLSRIDEYMSSQRLLEVPFPVGDIRQQPPPPPQQQQPQIDWPAGTQMNFGPGGAPEMDPQFSFQLPQELLVDWPWPLDLSEGFGNF
jgi:hypothetical protein